MDKETRKALRQYDGMARRVSATLSRQFGTAEAFRLIGEIRNEFEKIIPELPDIGSQPVFNLFLTGTGWALAMYRTGEREGWSVEQSGQLVFDVTKAYLQSFPKIAHKFLRWLTNSRLYQNHVRRLPIRSQERRYPADYVFNYIDGNGEDFDYGVDYLECVSCKFLQTQGGMQIAPYLCNCDQLYSELWGWGLVRTQTLASGGTKCDFRFTPGGETRIVIYGNMILNRDV
jgi:hypothetical protein